MHGLIFLICLVFLSTPSARRATNFVVDAGKQVSYFYPRPPRGGRRGLLCLPPPPLRISIHALREEGDAPRRRSWTQSDNFYPRPPRGGRLWLRPCATISSAISIHALREEGDQLYKGAGRGEEKFLSTPSARRATID